MVSVEASWGNGMRAYRRVFALITASALACGVAVGTGAAPAAAAVGVVTGLTTAGQACVGEAPGPYLSPDRLNDANAVVLKGAVAGATAGADLEADFQVWDVTTPDERQQWLRGMGEENDEVYVQLEDRDRQLDGVTYAWRVRVLGDGEPSPWSATCYFTVDRSGGEAPAVTSAEYPEGDWEEAHGEIGAPGIFTFTASADDTVSYAYRFYSSEAGGDDEDTVVPAERLGGPAKVTWTPEAAGYHSVRVYAIDRAGNYSEQGGYSFYVRETRPSIFSSAYPDGTPNLDYNVGVAGAFELSANVPDTESFAWHIDGDGPSGSVAADDEGEAVAMIAPTRPGRQTLYVQSVTRAGKKHAARAYTFVVDNAPKVTGDVDRGVTIGSSLRFHFAPRAADVEAYVYWPSTYDGEKPERKVIVPARADGTADLTWTADNDNRNVQALHLQSRSKDGTLSERRYLSMSVWDADPTVNRRGGDVLGTSATFTARTEMVNPVEYEVTLNREPATRQVVRAAADGTATFQVTPTVRGYNYVTVVARNAAGVVTGEGGSNWTVFDSPVVTSKEFPASGEAKIAPGSFTFTSRQAGTTAYEYSLNCCVFTRIPAEADGTATLEWTPTRDGYYTIYVRSLTASGARSMETTYSFRVAPDPLTVTAVSPGSVPRGNVRTITITGTSLSSEHTITVTPAGGEPLPVTTTSVSEDRKRLTGEVDLTSAPAGKAAVAVQEYYWSDPVVLADAFTIADAAALVATARPVITGAVAVSATVRASTGTWTPAGTAYTYQWAANGTPISGATGETYKIPAAQVGKKLTVTVRATRADYVPAQATSDATEAVAKSATLWNTAKPKITGTAVVGATIEATNGAWSPGPDSYRYEWRVGGTVQGTTAKTLTLTAAMAGKPVTVTVVAVKAGYLEVKATSPAMTVASRADTGRSR